MAAFIVALLVLVSCCARHPTQNGHCQRRHALHGTRALIAALNMMAPCRTMDEANLPVKAFASCPVPTLLANTNPSKTSNGVLSRCGRRKHNREKQCQLPGAGGNARKEAGLVAARRSVI